MIEDIKRPKKRPQRRPMEFREYIGAQAPVMPTVPPTAMESSKIINLGLMLLAGLLLGLVLGRIATMSNIQSTPTPPGQLQVDRESSLRPVTPISNNSLLQPAPLQDNLQLSGKTNQQNSNNSLQAQSSDSLHPVVPVNRMQGSSSGLSTQSK